MSKKQTKERPLGLIIRKSLGPLEKAIPLERYINIKLTRKKMIMYIIFKVYF